MSAPAPLTMSVTPAEAAAWLAADAYRANPALAPAALFGRFLEVQDQLRQDFVSYAKAKGFPLVRVVEYRGRLQGEHEIARFTVELPTRVGDVL
jgi:hypothetical protein